MNIFFGLTGNQIGMVCLVSYIVIADVVMWKCINNKSLVSMIIPLPHKIAFALTGFLWAPWLLLAMVFEKLGSLSLNKEERNNPAYQKLNSDTSLHTAGLFIMIGALYAAAPGLSLLFMVEHQNDKPVTNDTTCVCKK